jgi:hypothetical protein
MTLQLTSSPSAMREERQKVTVYIILRLPWYIPCTAHNPSVPPQLGGSKLKAAGRSCEHMVTVPRINIMITKERSVIFHHKSLLHFTSRYVHKRDTEV